MAQTDRETINALLTDTVTLLCRNSLPFDRTLKVQGLLGITVDEAEVYIVQIDEEFGEGMPPETMVQSVPPRTRVPVGRIPAKRARMGTARTPMRRVVQTAPRRMGPGIGAVSPGSALARQKVRQQLNFPTPSKMPQMGGFPAGSPGNMRPVFARESPAPSAQGSATPQAFTQASPPIFQQSPRMPKTQKHTKPSWIEDKKMGNVDRPPTASTNQMPHKPVPKVEKPDSYIQRPLKVERTQGDIICVESDEENSDTKRLPSLLPFSGSGRSTVEDMVDDKTVALQAIMAQALNQARAVGSGRDDNFRVGGGLYPVKSEGGQPELKPMKAEAVSSSQLTESDMMYDVGIDGAQFQSDFGGGGLDLKPVFDDSMMQIPWELGGLMPPMSSPTASRPASQSRFMAQSLGSTPRIKTEDEQGHASMAKCMTPSRNPFYPSTDPDRAFATPQKHWGMNVESSGIESADDYHQDAAGNWKSVTTTKFICHVDNCDKEFTTKRSMRRHQKTLHGVTSRDGGEGDSDSESMQQQLQDNPGNWTSATTTKFICGIDNCGKEFTTKRSMRRHQRTLHGAASEDGGDGNSDTSSNAAFHCDISDD